MRTRSCRLLLSLLLGVVCLTATAVAQTGRLKGVVTDIRSGQPVIGASVQIVGTTLGARTDHEGRYQILRIPTGSYTLKVTSVEYENLEIADVEVLANRTTTRDVEMELARIDISKTIGAIGEADVIDKFVTTDRFNLVPEQIKTKPVQTVDALLEQVAGVQTTTTGDVFVRGGRAGEVSYIVGGVEIGDPLGGIGNAGANLQLSTGQPPPAHGGSTIVNGEPFDAMFFKHHGVNPFVDTEDDQLSTFAIDVDDASFVMARSYLDRGHLPPSDAVRVEEFINHFEYSYPAPEDETFRVYLEAAPSPFGPPNSLLMRIGIKGREVPDEERKPANLVFVVDVSGSMASGNRLGLVRRSLELLTNGLRTDDSLAIVVYGSSAAVRLEPTAIGQRDKILPVIKGLMPTGSTNAEAGIKLGYEQAMKMNDPKRINRVILCSDGVANVGRTGPDAILREIDEYRKQGIQLTTVGFGMGNYNDILMERLGNRGDGEYAYIDTFEQAKMLFETNLTQRLETIARDVKLQVDFNPATVRSYRLLGYENRDVADEKFRDDTEDGGEIGSGHTVTALYEIKLVEQPKSDRLATVFMRWMTPESDQVIEKNYPMLAGGITPLFELTSNDFKLAATAAEFAEILRGSYWAREGSLTEVAKRAAELERRVKRPEISELLSLATLASAHNEELASR